jgi:hypothetical protein
MKQAMDVYRERCVELTADIARLKRALEVAQAEIARLKPDADRLDAIQQRASIIGYSYTFGWDCRQSLRQAIDAARTAPAKPQHVCGLTGYNGMIDPPCEGCEKS